MIELANETKSVYIPQVGDMLTNGTRLVEVVERCREGYVVVDANSPIETTDPREREVLQTEVAIRKWRKVSFNPASLGDFDDAA